MKNDKCCPKYKVSFKVQFLICNITKANVHQIYVKKYSLYGTISEVDFFNLAVRSLYKNNKWKTAQNYIEQCFGVAFYTIYHTFVSCDMKFEYGYLITSL